MSVREMISWNIEKRYFDGQTFAAIVGTHWENERLLYTQSSPITIYDGINAYTESGRHYRLTGVQSTLGEKLDPQNPLRDFFNKNPEARLGVSD